MDRERLARLLAESIEAHGWHDMGWDFGERDNPENPRGEFVKSGFEEVWIGGNHEAAPTNLLAVADDVLAAMKET